MGRNARHPSSSRSRGTAAWQAGAPLHRRSAQDAARRACTRRRVLDVTSFLRSGSRKDADPPHRYPGSEPLAGSATSQTSRRFRRGTRMRESSDGNRRVKTGSNPMCGVSPAPAPGTVPWKGCFDTCKTVAAGRGRTGNVKP